MHEIQDIKWQKELADAELHEAFNKRSRESHRHPGHCEYMIDYDDFADKLAKFF